MLKLNWVRIISITLIQCLVGFIVFMFYLFFSWMFLGEGADSLLYTSGNEIVWAISPFIGATILNGYRIFQANRANDKRKLQTYISIQILFTLAYMIFTIIKITHNGYRI